MSCELSTTNGNRLNTNLFTIQFITDDFSCIMHTRICSRVSFPNESLDWIDWYGKDENERMKFSPDQRTWLPCSSLLLCCLCEQYLWSAEDSPPSHPSHPPSLWIYLCLCYLLAWHSNSMACSKSLSTPCRDAIVVVDEAGVLCHGGAFDIPAIPFQGWLILKFSTARHG